MGFEVRMRSVRHHYLWSSTSRPRVGSPGSMPWMKSFEMRYDLRRSGKMQIVLARNDEVDNLEDLLKEDLERLQQQQQKLDDTRANSTNAWQASARDESSDSRDSGGLKDAVDKILIADFFFILFALAWLGFALGVRSVTDSTDLLDLWLALWDKLFQPAIGVLMLGALTSGAIGWINDKKSQR